MRKTRKFIIITIAFILLFTACCVQAAAENAAQTMNILLLACEGEKKNFTPIMPMVVSLDFADDSLRVVNFFYQTKIETVTRKGKALSMPMSFLSYCDTPEIVEAFENTFGIVLDRYLIYKFDSYAQPLKALELLCPIKLDVAEEVMNNVEFPSVNDVIKMFAKSLKKESTPLAQAGEQELDALSCLSYLYTTPDRVWASSDRLTVMMEDYTCWDAKNQAAIEALRPSIARMDPATVLAFWELLTDGQDTNITADDIGAWSAVPFNFPDAAPYCTAPGFEGIEMRDFDAGALTGVRGYDVKMLGYDSDAIMREIQDFLNGQ